MNVEQAKEEFVKLWGNIGTSWGISRSMAQVHALLLVSADSQCTEDVMEKLQISRGNANMNLRELMAWNLIYKDLKTGDRREFFRAEKDVWEMAKRIVRERKRREIEPLRQQLQQLKAAEHDQKDADFVQLIGELEHLLNRMDSISDAAIRADEHVVWGVLTKLLKR